MCKTNTLNTMKKKNKISSLISLIASPNTAFLMYEIGEEIRYLVEEEENTFEEAVSRVKQSKEMDLHKRENKVPCLEGFNAFKMKLSIQQLKDEIKIIEVIFKGWFLLSYHKSW